MIDQPTALAGRPSERLTRDQRLEMYYYARLTRDVEERLTILYRQSKILGGLYRSLGQEGGSVASAYALDRRDAIGPLIRNLGSMLVMGVRPRDLFAQYLARGTSPTRGREVTNHFVHLPPAGADEPTIVGPISMLGDLVAVLAGIAMGARMQQRPLVAMTYIGDGGTSTGAFHEAMNFAAVQKLPFVVIAEDNKYAYSTPTAKQMAILRIDQRAEAYGIPHELVDGNDMCAVYDASCAAVARARAGGGPTLIGLDTMRMKGHAEHDDTRYVPPAVLEEWQKKDPILGYRRHLIETGTAGDRDLAEIDAMTKAFADEQARLAEADPMPDAADVRRGVYAGDDVLTPRIELIRSPFAART